MTKTDFKPPIGNELFDAKSKMLADQEERRRQQRPIPATHAVAYARELLSVLETRVKPQGPARVTMATAGPLKDDVIPSAREPERIGGCFSDIQEDTKRNEGAHAKEIEAVEETETAIPSEDDEAPFG